MNGAITINGTGGSGGASQSGLSLDVGGAIRASGTGSIVIAGVGGTGPGAGGSNIGVRLRDNTAAINSVSGAIDVVATRGQQRKQQAVTASGFRVGGLPGVLGAGFDVIYGLGAAFSAFAAVSGGTTSVSAPLFAAVDQSGQLPPIVLASIGVTRGLLSGALQDDDPRTASQCS